MADAMKSVGQTMQQEPADEFMRLQGHLTRCVVVAIILPAKCHAGIVGMHEPIAGDGDAVGITTEIGQYMRGRAEGRRGISDPAFLAQRADRLGKASAIV